MQEITTRVDKQELEIMYIKKALDELVDQNKKQNEQLEKISDSIHKQEVILEKVSNLEDKYADGLRRCHQRIDETLEIKQEIKKQLEQETKKIDKRQEKFEEEIESVKKEIRSKPCGVHNVVDNEIKHMKETIEFHKKILFGVIGFVFVAVGSSILHMIIK